MMVQEAQKTTTIDLYQPSDAAAFKALNIAWLDAFFEVEPFDEQVLSDPERYILSGGGQIVMARDGKTGAAIGTGALLPLASGDSVHMYEVTKMSVDPAYQGQGIGRRILQALMLLAEEKGMETLIIYSSRRLENAIHLYRSEGFVEVPILPEEQGRYARCDIKLERRR